MIVIRILTLKLNPEAQTQTIPLPPNPNQKPQPQPETPNPSLKLDPALLIHTTLSYSRYSIVVQASSCCAFVALPSRYPRFSCRGLPYPTRLAIPPQGPWRSPPCGRGAAKVMDSGSGWFGLFRTLPWRGHSPADLQFPAFSLVRAMVRAMVRATDTVNESLLFERYQPLQPQL